MYNRDGDSMKKVICGIILIIFCITLYFLYINIYGIKKDLKINLNGEDNVTIEYGNAYNEAGVVAKYGKKDISNKVLTESNLDIEKVGSYSISYIIKYKKLEKKVIRNISVVDTTKPNIELKESDLTFTVGDEYKEPGYIAVDNYDGDITDKVLVTNNIDKTKEGEYQVTYKVKDSSNNEDEKIRNVKYNKKIIVPAGQKIAVLNYHFFYDSRLGESCNESICEDMKDFEAQLNYLKENNYKTLTMKEFKAWMYNEMELPEKSVLITIDDGAMGTGKHNGNKLIPILEKYDMHATLFLITGWWDIGNYSSPNLEVESHTNDMHLEGRCTGITRGAQMLCSSYDDVVSDLNKSIEITNSKTAFCFPFYVSDSKTIQAVKDVGFSLAFVGGNRKASRSDNKYQIPRYPIHKSTSLNQFINMVN